MRETSGCPCTSHYRSFHTTASIHHHQPRTPTITHIKTTVESSRYATSEASAIGITPTLSRSPTKRCDCICSPELVSQIPNAERIQTKNHECEFVACAILEPIVPRNCIQPSPQPDISGKDTSIIGSSRAAPPDCKLRRRCPRRTRLYYLQHFLS